MTLTAQCHMAHNFSLTFLLFFSSFIHSAENIVFFGLFVCLFYCSSNNTKRFQLQGFCICGSLCLECFSPKYAYDFFFICFSVCAQSLRHVWLFLTPWTVAPLAMEYFKQEYWNRLPLPTPGDLPDPRIKRKSLASPALASWFLATAPPGRKLFHPL